MNTAGLWSIFWNLYSLYYLSQLHSIELQIIGGVVSVGVTLIILGLGLVYTKLKDILLEVKDVRKD